MVLGPPNRPDNYRSWDSLSATARPQVEYMAEVPVKPKGRDRRPQPVTLSMFEWVLTLEQEGEAEPVGAGR